MISELYNLKKIHFKSIHKSEISELTSLKQSIWFDY